MQNARKSVLKFLNITLRVVLGVIILCVAAIACLWYADWSAPRNAREFCDEIAIGSDISAAIARANEKKIVLGPEGGYSFYFPSTGFDKAICAVSVDQGGKVTSKGSEMEYD